MLRCWDKLVVPLVNHPMNWIGETRGSLMTGATLTDEQSLAVAWEVEARADQLEQLEARTAEKIAEVGTRNCRASSSSESEQPNKRPRHLRHKKNMKKCRTRRGGPVD
ncbi:hypothetical protein CRG98_000474 [Punica granatum]|uniref:Uncharacterized protein n=1 Tax=Punica granatum TaxID=22663 RepID=A0A2I0LES4_PUNGR|nr:hypothetical protein CRG98_000474 [Punica granatum]